MNTTTTITDEIGEMNECNEARSSSEGWEQLMGNDIILYVYSAKKTTHKC